MMTKIEKLVKEYKEAEEFASKDLSAWPVATLPGAQMRKRECQETVKKIEAQYAEALKANTFTIFPFVEQVDAEESDVKQPDPLASFMEIMRETANPLTIEADTLYAKLAKEIEPTMGDRRTFGTTQVVRLMALLVDLGRDLGVRNIQMPQQFDLVHCATTDDLVAYVRTLVRSMIGDRFNQVFIETEIVRTALSIRYTRSIVPVVVLNATAEERESLGKLLFSGTSFAVPVKPGEISKENVLKVLSDIKKAIKK